MQKFLAVDGTSFKAIQALLFAVIIDEWEKIGSCMSIADWHLSYHKPPRLKCPLV